MQSTSSWRETPIPQRAASLRLHRLKNDIAEFRDEPYPGVEIFVQDDSYDKICLHLIPQSGPLVGLRLHFDFELPHDWPQQPPKVRCSFPSGLPHPNVFGDYICCDLLNIYADQRGYNGYTPAFTLRALCMQLLSFFSSSKVEQEYGGFHDMGEEFSTKYIPETLLSPKNTDIKNTLRPCFNRYDRGDFFLSGTEFLAALPHSRTNRTYINIDDGKELPEGATPCKAGSWSGWKTSEPAQREVEITKVIKDGKLPGYAARVRYRNPIWYQSYYGMRMWTGCVKCKYNKEGGPALVRASLVTTLKEAVKKIDGNQIDENEGMDLDAAEVEPIAQGSCEILKLGPELLLALADHLPSEAMNSLASAFPPFKAVIQRYHVALYRDIRCFFLRTGLNSPAIHQELGRTILGIGVGADRRDFRSSFDWLSLEAFEVYGVRQGIDKIEFGFFLPMVFSKPHFQRAYSTIWRCINRMADHVRIGQQRQNSARRAPIRRGRGGAHLTDNGRESEALLPMQRYSPEPNASNIQVIYQFMNSIIVSLMKACDDVLLVPARGSNGQSNNKLLQASEKSIIAYCQLFYLLMRLTKRTPQIRKDAFEVINGFRLHTERRKKDVVPDLGHFIVQLLLVNGTVDTQDPNPAFHKEFSWPTQIAGPYLQEVMIRNVRWVLDKNPGLEYSKHVSVNQRLEETFEYSKTSVRLVMFQTFFLRFIVGNHLKYPTQLEENFGFPPEGVAEAVVREIKKIYGVKDWKEYFNYIGYERGSSWDKEKMCDMLKECIANSRERGYHSSQQARFGSGAIRY
ncbi:hypothetical protein ABW19_dt0208502 [Dactylella cylindrospora]|nr:hypothetical protein ABW19_dt0208502 [Dactylella cylindrospora]